jgi:hypothetical protein
LFFIRSSDYLFCLSVIGEYFFFAICLSLKKNKHVMCTFIYSNHLNILFWHPSHAYLVHYHLYIHLYFNHEHLLMLLQEAAISCWSNHQLQRMIIRDYDRILGSWIQNALQRTGNYHLLSCRNSKFYAWNRMNSGVVPSITHTYNFSHVTYTIYEWILYY